MTDAIPYFGWYSEQTAGVFNDPDFHFRPGAIAVHVHSASAYQSTPEKFRCVPHQADVLRSLKRDAALAELIKKAPSRFTDEASKPILRSY
jgi:hypothetical protein